MQYRQNRGFLATLLLLAISAYVTARSKYKIANAKSIDNYLKETVGVVNGPVLSKAEKRAETCQQKRQADEENYWLLTKWGTVTAAVGALVAAGFAFGAYRAAGRQADAADGQLTQAKSQTADIKRQADAITTPYIYASVISREDTSKEAYYAKAEPLFQMGGFDLSAVFINFGQAPGVVYGAKCALFYGANLKSVKEGYFRKIEPNLAIQSEGAAAMTFWRHGFDNKVVIVGSAASSIKTEDIKCSPGVENAAGFAVNSTSSLHDIAKFIAMRGYYLKVAFRIEGISGSFNECFRLILPSRTADGLSFLRKQDNCEDWDEQQKP